MIFTVVIPVFNAERFLPEALRSVENQAFHNYQVVLVDDGSTDGSGEICDAFARNRENVLVIHKNNEGPLMARYSALEVAQGEYTVFLDADDR